MRKSILFTAGHPSIFIQKTDRPYLVRKMFPIWEIQHRLSDLKRKLFYRVTGGWWKLLSLTPEAAVHSGIKPFIKMESDTL